MKGSRKDKESPINIYIDSKQHKIEDRETESFSKGRVIYRRRRATTGQKLLLGLAAFLSLGAIAVAFGIHYGTTQQTTLTRELSTSENSLGSSLIKVDASGNIVKTTNDESIGILLRTGGTFTGELKTTKKIDEFVSTDFVTREYVDSLTGSVAANSDDKLATNEYLNRAIDPLVLKNPSDAARNLLQGPVTTTRNAFIINEFITKNFVDQEFVNKASLNGASLTGFLTINKGTANFLGNEFITKTYTDTKVQSLNTDIDTSLNGFISINDTSTATGAVLVPSTKTAFDEDEFVPKKYFDNELDPILVRPLSYLDTKPLIPEAQSIFYSYNDGKCDPPAGSAWSGWRAKDINYKLVDDSDGVTSPNTFIENPNTPSSVARGFLSYFGVEYNVARLIRKYPENVKIAFSVIDTRIGINRSVQTPYFSLNDLDDTVIAATISGETYNVRATFSKDNGTIKITSNHVGSSNCFGAINGISLAGYVPSFIADEKSTSPIQDDNNPIFR